jgi:predicted O-linked N-acetylglucosamine transferase (SPINDLY family)
MFTAAAWTSSMLACVYQWFTQYSARFAVTTVGLGDDLQALEMIKGGGCEALSILRIGDSLSDEDAYRLVCSKEFDIIVDLDCGSGARSAMKARKGIAGKVIYAVGTACLQPKGTNCDYVLGDSMTFPPETRSESVPVLKVGFSRPFSIGEALTARERDSSSKADFKLPSDGFIFMHVQEVSPASTEALNLLLSVVQGTPGSFLVMVGQTLWAQASFLEQARAFATAHNWFDPEVRVLFRPWPTSTGDRVRLMRHGDLLLANCEGGSITGAGMQALASCLPVLVCVSKKQRKWRVACPPPCPGR